MIMYQTRLKKLLPLIWFQLIWLALLLMVARFAMFCSLGAIEHRFYGALPVDSQPYLVATAGGGLITHCRQKLLLFDLTKIQFHRCRATEDEH